MNILRLSPDYAEKNGISDYSVVFDKILKQEGIQIIKPKYLFADQSTWWLPLDFIFRKRYWEKLINSVNLVHAEIGIHQAREVLTLYFLGKKNIKTLLTIHDPGQNSYKFFKIYNNTSGYIISKLLNKVSTKIDLLIDKLFFGKVFENILDRSLAIFVFNMWGANQLLSKYPKTRGKISIINPPIFDFPKCQINETRNRDIVFAGFWSENKGIETLLQAYSLLLKEKKIKVPRIVLAGETQVPNSSYIKHIKREVNRLGLKNLVDFPGFLPEGEMFELFSRSFLVIPYNNKIAGSVSSIYIRGLQSGAVTIVSDNPTLSSFAKQNNFSLIFKQGSASDLAKKIIKVIENQKLSYHLAKLGQDFIYDYGDWKKIGRLMSKIYSKKLSFFSD